MEIRGHEDDTRRLYAASMEGCVSSLNELIKNDPLILKKVSLTTFTETPLHVSALHGHHEFTQRLLDRNRKLAEELDSFKRSALHLASAEGHRDTVVALLEVYGDACLILDENGRIPLHYAAMRGRVEVLKELIQAKRESIYVNVQNGSSKETVLHLCVRHNKLECLKVLVEEVEEDRDFLNSRGCDGGMTILLLALMLRQAETISYLLTLPAIREEANSVNGMALNMLDALRQSPRDFKTLEVQQILMDAGIKREINESVQPLLSTRPKLPPGKNKKGQKAKWLGKLKAGLKYKGHWLQDIRGDLMLVATIISTMTFQVAINPPGGVWQEHVTNSTIGGNVYCSEENGCYAGTAVLAYVWKDEFDNFMQFNSIAFHASLSVTLLLLSGFPLNNRICMWLLSMAMCATLVFVAQTYSSGKNLVLHRGSNDDRSASPSWTPVQYISFSLFFGVLVWNTIRFLIWLVKKLNSNMNGCSNASTTPKDFEENRIIGV